MEKGIIRIEVTYIGKKGEIKTDYYTRRIKDIFQDLSYTTKEVEIE